MEEVIKEISKMLPLYKELGMWSGTDVNFDGRFASYKGPKKNPRSVDLTRFPKDYINILSEIGVGFLAYAPWQFEHGYVFLYRFSVAEK